MKIVAFISFISASLALLTQVIWGSVTGTTSTGIWMWFTFAILLTCSASLVYSYQQGGKTNDHYKEIAKE